MKVFKPEALYRLPRPYFAVVAAALLTAPVAALTPPTAHDRTTVKNMDIAPLTQVHAGQRSTGCSASAANLQSIMLSAPKTIIELLKVGTPVVTMIGIFLGVWQYRKGQNWKRMEFASSLVRRVSEEPTLSLATLFIDWKKRMIRLPDIYQTLEQVEKECTSNFFYHSYQEMAATFSIKVREVIPETNRLEIKESEITVQRTVYIDSFDRLFEFFQEVESFLSMRLIKSSDIDVLAYWAEKLLNTKYNEEYIFRWYLSYYDLWGPFAVASAGLTGNLLIFSAPLDKGEKGKIKFHLANGKRIIVPIKRLSVLKGAKPEELASWEISDDGRRITFNRLGHMLSVDEILRL